MLDDLLKSIKAQKLAAEKYEVIVVDNCSSDGTAKVCASYEGQIKNLDYVLENQPGLHKGRHAGLKKAKGDILIFADDDIKAFPSWLGAISEAFEDKDVMLAGGKCLPLFEIQPPPWLEDLWQRQNSDRQILPFLSLLDLGNSIKEISPYYVFGCNFSIRRHILLQAGGFHPDAMPWDLIRYRGDGETHISQFISSKRYKTIYHPKASVYHRVSKDRMTKDYFSHRYYIQGISDSFTQLRNGGFRYHWTALALRTIKRLPLFCINRLHARAYKAYLEGYCYHRREVRRSPELNKWVHRENYLE